MKYTIYTPLGIGGLLDQIMKPFLICDNPSHCVKKTHTGNDEWHAKECPLRNECQEYIVEIKRK